jgi:diguanylate cyclase (GGDEF)-like protein
LAEQADGGLGAERRISAEISLSGSLEPATARAVQRARLAVGSAQTSRDVIDVVIGLVRTLGGQVVPVGLASSDAFPWNLTLGVDEALLALVDPGSEAWKDLNHVLPVVLEDARRAVIHLRLQALKRDPATSDAVTGLVNRAAFDAQLKHLEPRDAIALVRLHHLQLLTDNAGAAATEAVLVAFARLLTDHVRASDSAGRYAEHTFALAIPGISMQSLAHRLELMRQAWNGLRPYTVTFSVGIAALDSTPAAALRAAAQALDSAVLHRADE